MDNRKLKVKIYLGLFLLIGILGSLSYAFFNYTRTGSPNTIKTGNITFYSEQGNTLNLTNIFPIKSENLNNQIDSLDGVTVNLSGATTYIDGEEFVVTLTNVNNTVNGKRIPLKFIATYTPNEESSIGTSSDTYWESRNNKDATIYTLTNEGRVDNNKQVLVGYIDNEGTGINGTLTIKAYVDGDRIAISDTFAEYDTMYHYNNNLSLEEVNACVSYLTGIWGPEEEGNTVDTGETYEAFCNGTGTNWGATFQDVINTGYVFSQEDLLFFSENNIIKIYTDGTTNEWVDGRVVFTTEEWNSFKTTPISFQIKEESNEGIWVNDIPASCFTFSNPTIKYMYNDNMTSEEINTCVNYVETWNYNVGETPEAFCDGTGTVWGYTFQRALDEEWLGQEHLEYFDEHNIIKNLGYTTTIENYDASCGSNVGIPSRVNTTLKTSYIHNANMAIEEINACISYLTNQLGEELEGDTVDIGETYEAFCNGTGTMRGDTFQQALDNNWFFQEELDYLEEHNIITSQTQNVNASVTALASNSFANKKLTSVIIPDSITTIGNDAFLANNIEKIVVSDIMYNANLCRFPNVIGDDGVIVENKNGTNSCTCYHTS